MRDIHSNSPLINLKTASYIRVFILVIIIFLLMQGIRSSAQTIPVSDYFPDIKILNSNGPSPGYFFLGTQGVSAPGAMHYIAIVDNWGTPVFFRVMPNVSISMRLLDDGTISYVHGVPRKLYLLNEMLDIIDVMSTSGYKMDGHDYAIDDGNDYNRIMFAQYNRTVDMSQLVEGGYTEAVIDESIVQEFDVDNNLLWSWRTEDHFSILDGNEESPFVNFTDAGIDYAHLNSVAISSDTSIYLSTRHMDEITNIDRRSGEIIWRLGGKNNQFTFLNDTVGFSHQHCPRKLPNGNILIFDNGNLHDPQFSSAVEYQLDEVNMTATLVNRLRRDPDGFSVRDGSTQRLENGNTIITWGPGWPSVTEFHPDGSIAIEFDFTEHSLSPRIEKYMWKTSIFESSVENLDFGMWNGSDPVERTITLKNNTDTTMHITSYSTRSGHFTLPDPLPVELLPGVDTEITISFNPNDPGTGFITDVITINSDNSTQRIARQIFLSGRIEDNLAPGVTFMPDSSDVPVSALITINFSEPVRMADNSELNYSNIDNLIILRKNNAGGEDVPYNANINTEKNTIEVKPASSLDSGTVYWVSVEDQFEDYSDNRLAGVLYETFTTAGTATSVIKRTNDTGIMVFPNPGKGIFNIKTGHAGMLKAEIYNLTGTVLVSGIIIQGPDFTLNLSDLPPGLYILSIRSDDRRLSGYQRVIISK
ncbi:MAG: T9SS type A sorting domain-containing protein [Bacteroidia bacterium]|nr:MAG: T9SS type A sorting domain-containing protein [Bacteroidia bacterium]